MTRGGPRKLTAKAKGELRKRRRHRAERREATKEIREKINAQKVTEGHPGWVERRRSRPYRWLDQGDPDEVDYGIPGLY